jgi:hypothetical protein
MSVDNEQHDRLLKAYRDASQQTRSLEDFFYQLALITGHRRVNERGEDVWTNRDRYPHDIHLAFLYFRHIASDYFPIIDDWHHWSSIWLEDHLNYKRELKVDVGYGGPNYAVNVGILRDIRNKINFTQFQWRELFGIIKEVHNRRG